MNPFCNLTVLSLEQATVLPYLTYRLAHDGVRVIRLEHPIFGDPNRKVGEPIAVGEDTLCSYFMAFNAGKEAVTINLKDPQGQAILRDLIVKLKVDIFATNQLPKNYESLGIDYESLKKVKPDLIWLGLTGFGPDSNEAAYDPILQARGGLMDLTGEADGFPQLIGIPLPDMGTSEHAYGLLMRALYKREATGEGERIDMAMIDSTVSWLTQPVTMAKSFGKVMTRRGHTHEFFAPVNVYQTSDGFVFVAVGNDVQWKRLVSLPGFSSLSESVYESNAGRIGDQDALNRKLSALIKNFSTAEIIGIFNKATIPIAKVQTIPEVCEDPAVKPKMLRAKDKITGFEVTMAPPPYMTAYLREQGQELSFPPRMGEHNHEIYVGLLGKSLEELKILIEQGTI